MKRSDRKTEEVRTDSVSSSPKRTRTGGFKFVQHILITIVALIAILLISESVVVINRYEGKEILTQFGSDSGRKYEDSALFSTIFGYEVTDVLRLVTIRTQMETNGAYDPDRIVDVSAYNARQVEGYDPSEHITVKYYLGDLLKWKRYGFYNEERSAYEFPVSANGLYGEEWGNTDPGYTENYLVNRYKSVEGLDIESYAHNREEYEKLCNALMSCAEDLYINYNEYLGLSDYFSAFNSNIRYCVVMEEGKDRVIYTNADITAKMNNEQIADVFKDYGRYLSYDSDRMRYYTNTAITESVFNTLINKYKYAYPDDCMIYIGADMSMPVNDCISSAGRGFNLGIPNRNVQIAALIICLILYLMILVACTILEGRIISADGNTTIRFTGFDNTPIELMIILMAVLFFGIGFIVAFVSEMDYDSLYKAMDYVESPVFYAVCGVAVFVLDIIILGMYYSLVRRIKGRHIWKQSFLYKIVCAIAKGVLKIYDNGNVLIKSVVPLGILGIINVGMIAMAFERFFPVACISTLVLIDIGACVFIFRQVNDRNNIIEGMKKIISGDLSYKTDIDKVHGDNKELGICVNSISDSVRNAVEQSMKDERMKTELLANVSHDIRTPLTSIINYVDLIKRENIENENVRSYVEVLDEKSQRLKTLTDDLIEVSKASSGNVELELVKINLPEMLSQAMGEFDERFTESSLGVVVNSDALQRSCIMADGRSLWRVLENLLGNVCKYSMPNTRVFIDMFNNADRVVLRITNMSQSPLPADLSELTERFIRGDESRTTEGSGLGLSIAKTLTELMGGTLTLHSEADLFKAEVAFEAVD